MTRTFGTTGAALAALLAAGGIWSLGNAAGAGATADTRTSSTRLDFFIHDTAQATGDVAPKGSSLGDGFFYHGWIADHRGGKRIGRFGGLGCIQLDGGGGVPADSSCEVDYILPSGTIYTHVFGSNDKLFGGRPFPFGITGGTGAYRGARGEGTIEIPTDVKDQTDAYVKLTIMK